MTDVPPKDALAQLGEYYAAELKSLVRLVIEDAPLEVIQRTRESLTSLSNQWSAMHWEAEARLLEAGRGLPVATTTLPAMDVRRYVFVRGDAAYQCSCEPWTSGNGSWTIRRESCEADGPPFSGVEFLNADLTVEFEALAIAAVKGCTKACALR